MRALFQLLAAIAISAAAAYYGQPLIIGNDQAVTILVTVFSVFAGFIVAVIAVVGDPALIPSGSWRTAELRRSSIERRLLLHSLLFMIYLLTLGFVFVASLISGVASIPKVITDWTQRVYLFLGCFAFLSSLYLPFVLRSLQRARVDAEIERRRREARIGAGEQAE